MRKNKTEYFSSDIIRFIPKIHIKLSKKEKKKLLEQKIEKEMKSNPEEFYNILKQNLRKNEITKETYLSKNVSNDKKIQPNLLISKVNIFDKYLAKKKKYLDKISKENLYFSKTYESLKKNEAKNGKQNTQLKYLNEVANLYESKNYDLDKGGLTTNENIFKYSILNDREFGNDINNNALRVIKEMDNGDFLREQKLIFDFQDELFNEKMNDKINHPADTLFKFKIKEPDLGIDDMNLIKKIKKNFFNKNDLEQEKEENKENNYEIKNENYNENNNENNKNDNYKALSKKRPSFLYLQIKNDLKKMRKSLLNLEQMKSQYKNERIISIKKSLKPRLSIINNSSDNQNIVDNDINKDEKKEEEEEEKEIPVILYNNTEINNERKEEIKPILIINGNKGKENDKINFLEKNDKRFSMFNNLPKINKLGIKNFQSSNTTTNYSFDRKDLHFQLSQKNKRNSLYLSKQMIKNKLISSESKPKDNNIKKLNINQRSKIINLKKDIDISVNSFLKGGSYKMPIKQSEIQKHIENFKNRRKTLYDRFLNNDSEINLHGFAGQFQRITEEKNFANVHNINKFLIRNNFSYVMSKDDLYSDDDENEGINVQKVDKKIENIVYDSADYLLGNRIMKKNHILG